MATGKWVQVLTAATQLVDQGAGKSGSATKPTSVAITNLTGNDTLYLGGANVNATTSSTAGKGFALAAGSSITMDLQGDSIYGIMPTNAGWVNLLIVGSS